MASSSASTSSKVATKRKRNTLSIETKLQILKKIEKGSSLSSLAAEYGTGKSTIFDIKRSREKIMKFATEAVDETSLKKRCIVRRADDSTFDKAIHLWFLQERHKGTPVSGVLLMEKAKILYHELNPEASDEDFKASSGWLHRFKGRHGIRQLSLQGETLSADNNAAEEFKAYFQEYVEENNLTLSQIFNCDETGLYWRLLPNKTLADASEKTAKNFKSPKDRVTLMATANASGDFKLPLVFIHKSKKPRCFSGVNMSSLPVLYYSQKKGWMDTSIFTDWFHKHFVPQVKRYLQSKSILEKAVLVLDNAPSHPAASTLISDDKNIKCLYLPPNVTSLVQPMDQGVLENVKRRYKRQLLRKLLLGSAEHESFIEFAKSLTIKDAVYIAAQSWNEISYTPLQRSWNKLGLGPSSMNSSQEEPVDMSRDCEQLGITEEEKNEWLAIDDGETGVPNLTDEEIIAEVQECEMDEHDNDEEIVSANPVIKHEDAEKAFSTCLAWLEQQQESTAMNLLLLSELQSLATKKKFRSLKQRKLCEYSI